LKFLTEHPAVLVIECVHLRTDNFTQETVSYCGEQARLPLVSGKPDTVTIVPTLIRMGFIR